MHLARMQPGATLAVFVDPQNPVDMAIDWIRTGQLAAAARFDTGRAPGAARTDVQQDAQQVIGVVAHQVVRAVQFVDVPVRIVLDPFVGRPQR